MKWSGFALALSLASTYCHSQYVQNKFYVGVYSIDADQLRFNTFNNTADPTHVGLSDTYLSRLKNQKYNLVLAEAQVQRPYPQIVDLQTPNAVLPSRAFLDRAKNNGLEVLLMDPGPFGEAWNQTQPYNSTYMQNSINWYGYHSALLGWYTYDEPGQNTNPVPSGFANLQDVTTRIRNYSSKKLSLACIYPDIADQGQLLTKVPNGVAATPAEFASYLDNYISTVNPDVVAYDYYPYSGAGGHNAQGFYRNLELFSTRMNPLHGKKRAMWNVIGYGKGDGITPGVVPQADLLTIPKFDNEIYSVMAYGSKGILYWRAEEEFFTAVNGPPYRYIVQDVMQQLPAATITHLTNVHASLINNGNELTSLNYAQAFHVSNYCDMDAGCTYDIPSGSEWSRFSSNRTAARYFSSNPFVAQSGSSINPLLVSFLKHDNGDDYFWVVNKSTKSTSSFTMNFKMKTNIRQVLTNTINLGINSLSLTLQPGEGRLFHFYAPRISSGLSHTLALKTNGTLWAWGQDESGQLGDGLQTSSPTPKQIGSANDWVAVGAGVGYSIALKSNGTLWGWGSNQYGQLGNSNTGTLQKTPAQIGTATDWRAISVGNLHTMALKRDGTLWGWGYNGEGELGAGFTNAAQTSPVQVPGTWLSVSAGSNHTVAIKYDGTIWSFGDNESMQLGNNQTANSSVPVREASNSTGWLAIAAGHRHTVAIASDNTLWSWGENLYGQLGCGCSNPYQGIPARFTSTTNAWSRIGTGNWHSGAVKSDGSLYLWGYDDLGQLGNNSFGTAFSPVRENLNASNWVWFGGKIKQSFGVRSDGTLWAWGDNQARQLGIYSGASYYAVPTQTQWKIFP